VQETALSPASDLEFGFGWPRSPQSPVGPRPFDEALRKAEGQAFARSAKAQAVGAAGKGCSTSMPEQAHSKPQHQSSSSEEGEGEQEQEQEREEQEEEVLLHNNRTAAREINNYFHNVAVPMTPAGLEVKVRSAHPSPGYGFDDSHQVACQLDDMSEAV